MQSAPLPANEAERLRALQSLNILDTEPEFLYDDVTELASQICDVPIGLVSLIDGERQWFKSRHGLNATETPRELAFCAHAILGQELFEIEDSRKDARFHDNPLVTDAPNVIFYAGIPLELDKGIHVGTLCVIDQKPKQLTEKQRSALRCLANQVVAHLRLRRANQELQKALTAKATFLASMSHEIRTPMNGIVGITNFLLDSSKDPETLEQLHIIRNCSEMLLTILNDILDFSKIEAGKITFEVHPFSLTSLVRNVREVLNPIAKHKNLHLTLEAGAPPDWLSGDSTRITQILMNLVGNALKFTSEGEVSLTVTKRETDSGDYELTFAVRDQGIGIPKEAQERLFKSFSQVDATTTRKFGGTGLGLAICKGLVDGMGGRIWIDSELGKGSTFSFTIVLAKAEAPAHEPAESIADSTTPLAETNPLRILIAEDNRVNQLIALRLVAKLGYTPDLAANGLEVLRMLETKTYDLILMDCHMPEMDGFEATEKIFEKFPAEHRPAIYALTAAVTQEEQTRCRDLGMALVLQKPITPQALRNALQNCPKLTA